MEAKWRMMRKGVLGGCVGIAVTACVTGGCFGGESAMAADSQTKCSDIVAGRVYNPSLKTACVDYQNNPKISHGALWLSNTKKTVDGKYNPDYLSSKVTTEEIDEETKKVDVFLRGAIIGGTDGKSNNAECIELSVKRGSVVYRPFSLSGVANLDTGAPSCNITQAGGKIKKIEKNYYVVRNENGNPFNNSITFSGLRVGLDVSNISQWGGGATKKGGRIDFKDVQVDVYRCFGDRRSEVDDPAYPSCGSSKSMVTIGGDLMSARVTAWVGSRDVEGKKVTTGEVVNTDKTASLIVGKDDECDNGCQITFKYEVLQKSGYKFGQSYYYEIMNGVNRDVLNSWPNSELVEYDDKSTETVALGKDEEKHHIDPARYSDSKYKTLYKTLTLYPGEVYCSRMNFGLGYLSQDWVDGGASNASICVAVKGELGTAISLDVQQQENDLESRLGFFSDDASNSFYVQPGTFKIGTKVTTNVQKAYGLRLKRVAIDGNLLTPDSEKRNVTLAERVLNNFNWSNTAKVTMREIDENNKVLYDKDLMGEGYLVGGRCYNPDFKRSELGEDWMCSLQGKSVDFQVPGHTYEMNGQVNVNASGDKSVPGSIEFVSGDEDGIYLRANIGTELVSNSLNVKVPYNFTNSTWVDGSGMKNINLESGFDVKYYVRVGDRKNTKLGDATYATQVDNATSGVYWCKAKKDQINKDRPGDVCESKGEGEVPYATETFANKEGPVLETLHPNDDEQNPNYERSISIGLKDKGVEVGDIICVWSWVTPGDSRVDLRMSSTWKDDTWGDGNTANSWDNNNSGDKKVCGQIGREKSPTIQVWGGNVLSKGQLDVSPVKEKTIKEKTRWFGSFGELGVFVKEPDSLLGGATSKSGNFASGAALGYGGIKQNGDSKDVLLPSYLGKKQGDSEEIGGGSGGSMGGLKNTIGINGVIGEIGDFAKALGGKYCGDNPSKCLGSGGGSTDIVEVSTDICGDENCEDKSVNICDENGNCVVKTIVSIKPGKSVVIGVDDVEKVKNVKIITNVQYEDKDGGYGSFSEVPRFIVIANNIEIGCGVTRIDGLLVATGTVNTCKSDTPEDREKKDHSNQLIVNGAIIADKLVANRTYGAGPGIYSIVPAEIVRFDPTLLDLDLGSNDSNPKIVNITELPPRY